MEKIEIINQFQEKGKVFENYEDFYKAYSSLGRPKVRIHGMKIENFSLVDSPDDFVDSYVYKMNDYYANMNIDDQNGKILMGFVLKNDTISKYKIELVERV